MIDFAKLPRESFIVLTQRDILSFSGRLEVRMAVAAKIGGAEQ